MTWNAACKNTIPKVPQRGWELVDNHFQPVWFNGPQMPESVLPNDDDFQNEEDEDSYDSVGRCYTDDSDTTNETDDEDE